ncbi:MAG: CYTH domain-containing protein [Pararobbsia sp.]
MAIEAELKLALPIAHAALARQVLDAFAGAPGEPVRFANVYYDTPDLALQRARSALRLRLAGDRWLQTFKSGGGASAGLHRRHEWEMPVAGETLDTAALLTAIERDLEAAAGTSARRKTQARTGNAPPCAKRSRRCARRRRKSARCSTRISRVRSGISTTTAAASKPRSTKVKSAPARGVRRQSMPILEIELELKQGDEAALHRLAKRLGQRIPGLGPDDVSKAERGYRLHARLRGA